MRSIWHHPWFLMPTLIFVIIGLAVMLHYEYGYEIIALNPWRSEPLNTFFRYTTRMSEPWAYIIIGLVASLYRLRYGLLIALLGFSTMAYTNVFKDLVGSERPIWYFELTGVIDQVVLVPDAYMNRGYTSFPSGHTMGAFGLYSLLALITGRKMPQLGLLLAWTAILIGVSRIFLVQHFMLDVLGGLFCGLLMADFWWQVDKRFMKGWTWLDWGVRRQTV